MKAPRRMLMFVAGFAVFVTAYLVYAHFLGGIDGLPPLPEEYWPTSQVSVEPLPPRANDAERRLREAFGDDEKIINCPIKLELRTKGLVLAAETFRTEKDGRVLLEPFHLAIFGKDRNQGEINTVRSRRALITFDQPVERVTDLNNRRIVGGELQQDIVITNNRRTPTTSDDLCLVTNGPLFYQESLQRVWTEADVRITDPQTKPEPMTVTATGADVFLTDAPVSPARKGAARSRGRPEAVSGVERVALRSDVDMNLWVDGRSGFLGGVARPEAKEPPGSPPATSPPPKKEAARISIQTQGPFQYDLRTDVAVFETAPKTSPSPNHVLVRRLNEAEGKLEQLVCNRLELKFLRKTAAAGANAAGPQGVSLEIETAHATGPNVTLTSDAENLNAFGTDLHYDARTRRTVLRGETEVLAAKDGNFIHARDLCLQQDAQGVQQASARGPGRVELLDKASGNRPLHAVWRDELTYGRQGTTDMMVLSGEASFVDQEHGQQLFADLIKVWLLPKQAAPGKATAAGPASDRPLPSQLEATGHVRLQAPDLRIEEAERLAVWFRDVPTAAAAPNPGQAAPSSAALGNSVDPARTAAPGLPPPVSGEEAVQKSTPGGPARTRKPLDLRARSVEAHVVRSGSKNDLEKLWCEGDVRVHQDPATPEEKGVNIHGEALKLLAHADGNVLTVHGERAKVQLDKLTILGPIVNIDQQQNKAWVNGAGLMQLPSNTSFEGTRLAKPSELTIHWKKSMFFDGQLAQFHGEVRAEQEQSTLQGESLQVQLDRRVSFKDEERGKETARVDKLVCDQDVRVQEAVREAGRLVSFKRIDAQVLNLDNDKEDGHLNAAGPGVVYLMQQGTRGELMPPAGPRPSPPAAARDPQAEQEMKLTRVYYRGRLFARNGTRTAKFFDGVEVIHVPAEDPDAPVDVDRLPPGGMYLRAEQLEVRSKRLADTKTSQELEASRKVFVQAPEFYAQADVAKYDESKDLLVFEGKPARLYKVERPGDRPREIKGEKILYERRTNHVKVERAHGIRFGD